MIKQQHKKPAIRAFTGIAGSPLSKLADVTPVSTTKPKVEASKPISDKIVLLHFCFDQRDGETKPASCRCKERVKYQVAENYVDNHRADWLRFKHWKAKDFSISHEAIVVRRMHQVDGEMIYAVVPISPTTDQVIEDSRAALRRQARRMLIAVFMSGASGKRQLHTAPDDEIDDMIENPAEFAENNLRGKNYKETVALVKKFWNYLLAGRKLSVNQGRYMLDADPGMGELVTGGYDLGKISQVADKQETANQRRVRAANMRAQGWQVEEYGKIITVWDESSYSAGQSPATSRGEGLEEDPAGGAQPDFGEIEKKEWEKAI